MQQLVQYRVPILWLLYSFGCVEIPSVKAEPPSYKTRTEIDFEKMDVSGSLTDAIPRVYDGIPRYYDTTRIVSSIITTADVELARSLLKTELTKTEAKWCNSGARIGYILLMRWTGLKCTHFTN